MCAISWTDGAEKKIIVALFFEYFLCIGTMIHVLYLLSFIILIAVLCVGYHYYIIPFYK